MDIIKKKELLKLQGYSNSDTNILSKVDTSYNDSNIIKSMKTTNNGFYNYSKVISNSEIELLNNIIDKNIKNAAYNIKDAKFDINPKEIDGKNEGCAFCEYRDICYMKNDDIVSLVKPENLFGGDNNGMD
jgi:ATP-dependent helicase/DNAse subunit B